LWHQQFRRDRVTEESTSKTIEGLGFVSNLKLTILYDNNPYNSSVTAAWGFSCLIQTEATTVLFDTGGDGHILLENMARLGIDASKVDVVVLSHIHSDHVGGLAAILEKNNRMRVCLPSSFADWFKLDIKRYRCEVIEVSNGTKISKGVATTGELNRGIKEQAVLLNTQKGLIVITGCAHPGKYREDSQGVDRNKHTPHHRRISYGGAIGRQDFINHRKDQISRRRTGRSLPL
jgi:hypothetical protein